MTIQRNFSLILAKDDEPATGKELLYFTRLEAPPVRLEIAEGEEEFERLKLYGCVITDPGLQTRIRASVYPVPLPEVSIYMLDAQGQCIAGYLLSDVHNILSAIEQPDGSLDIELAVEFFFPVLEDANVLQAIWSKGIHQKNMWANLDTSQRLAWIRIAIQYSFPDFCDGDKKTDQPGGMVYEMDGTYITDFYGFFIAISEAINGPATYFGNSLQGLDSCLCGGFGASTPLTLVWKNAGVARRALDQQAYTDYVLHDREMSRRTGYYEDPEEDEGCLRSIEDIKAMNLPALFDEIVDFLSTRKGLTLILED